MILKKLDSVKKEISVENYLVSDKFEKYHKQLLEGTLRNLHVEIQDKQNELTKLRQECETTKALTAIDTSDIPYRQPCNNPSFF